MTSGRKPHETSDVVQFGVAHRRLSNWASDWERVLTQALGYFRNLGKLQRNGYQNSSLIVARHLIIQEIS